MKFVSILFIGLMATATSARACEDLDNPPGITVKLSGNRKLVVCGYEEKKTKDSGGRRHFSEFQIELQSPGKETEYLMTAGASEDYFIRPIQNGLELEELWHFGGRFRPAFQKEIRCGKSDCKFSTPKCVVAESVKDIPKPSAKRKTSLEGLFIAAIGGDKLAAEKLRTGRPVSADGAVAEDWTTYQGYYERLKEAGCVGN